MSRAAVLSPLFLLAATAAVAQPAFRVVPDDPWCRDVGRDHERAIWCEVREAAVPAPSGILSADASPNGGVSARGSDRRDVRVRALVVGRGGTEAEARALAGQVKILTSPAVRAEGPAASGSSAWWVSFELEVPRRSDLRLASVNGPVAVSAVDGRVELDTQNGPLSVSDAAGTIKGRTTNGPVKVRLTGTSWSGAGLDVETVNGPVVMSIPAEYNARLEAGTVNGPMKLGFPLTVEGRLRRDVTTTLGSGGALVRARTTNGPLALKRP
jgi:hypothetical protein